MVCILRIDITYPTKLVYNIRTKIAKETATMLNKPDFANAMVLIGLFYFLLSLYILQQLGMLSIDHTR